MAAGIFRRRQPGPNQPLRVNAGHPLAPGLGLFGWGIGGNRLWDALTGKVIDLSAAANATGTFVRGAGRIGPTLRMAGGERGGGAIYNPTSRAFTTGTLAAAFKPSQAVTGGATRPYVAVGNSSLDRGLIIGMSGTDSHAWGVTSSNGWLFSAGSGVDEQVWRTVGVNVTPGVSQSVEGWLDGAYQAAASHTGVDIGSSVPTRIWFGRDPSNYYAYPTGDTGWVGYWTRRLDRGEHRLLHEDAWSLVAPASLVQGWRFAGAGSTAYTLTADAGALAITGPATALTVGRLLAADLGTVALSGQGAGLAFGRVLSAGGASVALTGIAAGLTVARALTADLGIFTASGVAAGLLAGRGLAAATGTYTLTGSAAGLLTARQIAAAPGTVTLAGLDAGLTYTPVGGYGIAAETGAFAIAGQGATLTAARALVAADAAFSIAMPPAGLLRGLGVSAATGSYTLAGQAAGALRGLALAADPAAFAVTGIVVDLIYAPAGGYTISADAAAFALTAGDAAFPRSAVMPADPGAFALTGSAAALFAGGQPAADPRRTVRLRVLAAWPAAPVDRAPRVRMGRIPLA